MIRPCYFAVFVATTLRAGPLAAQDSAQAGPRAAAAIPAAVITAAAIARHAAVLAADSLRGRATPSPALERTAQYLAAQFQQLGLTPGAFTRQGWAWLERYPPPGRLRFDDVRSGVLFGISRDTSERFTLTDTATASFASTAYWAVPMVAQVPARIDGESQGILVVTGRQTPASLAAARP